MYSKSLRFQFATLLCLALGYAVPCSADSTSTEAPSAGLVLTTEFALDTFDAEAFRAALERELSIPVQRIEQVSTSHLAVSASSVAAVRVAFVRADASRVERSVDLSSSGAHAIETLALLAANLMRDEAAELLASLRPSPEPAPTPSPPAAVTPPPPPPPPLPTGCAANRLLRAPFGIDFVPYLGSSAHQGTRYERRFSFNVLGGVTGAVRGAEIAGVFNLEAHSLCGVQFAGAANLVNGPVQGAQFGQVNVARGRLDGAQFGMIGVAGPVTGAQFGLIAISGGDVVGAQFGLVNLAAYSLGGVQYGLVNVAGSSVQGIQAGLANVNGGATRGLQLGLANVSAKAVNGGQIGLLNVSGEGVHGIALGLANVSSLRIDGAAIGLLNIAPDADAAIGLVNVLWRGRTQVDLWGTDFGTFHIGLEHGSRVLHNHYGLGLGFRDGRAVYAPSYGIGGRLFQSRWLFVDVDLLAYGLFSYDSTKERFQHALVAQLRVPVGLRIVPGVAIFVSPALNVSVADPQDDRLADPALYASTRLGPYSEEVSIQLWPGFTVGARFF